MNSAKDLYIGLMSGTSVDAIDVALVEINDKVIQLVASCEYEIPLDIKQRILQLSQILENTLSGSLQSNGRIEEMAQLDVDLGILFAKAVKQILKENSLQAEAIVAIGSHGQTIRHRPDYKPAFSLQIGDPNQIAEISQITTVADFRRADMAAGGQGAPLVPAFHQAIMQSDKENRIILNLGGIANISLLAKDPAQAVIGFDTGPANSLLDSWYKKHHPNSPRGYDKNGAFAKQGRPNQALLNRLLADPYFKQDYPKSTGREYFNLHWLEKKLESLGKELSAADIQATLVELTAKSIQQAIESIKPEKDFLLVRDYHLYCCGGGIHNQTLMQSLVDKFPQVSTSHQLGIDADYVEAICFAWLAYRRINHLPSNLPSATGASKAKSLGAIYCP